MYLRADIERWGSGIKKIYEACEEEKVKVEFQKLKSGFLVTFYRREIDELESKVTENQKKILGAILKNSRITSLELAKIISISDRKIKENIKKLKEKGVLKRIGPDKGGYWEVRGVKWK